MGLTCPKQGFEMMDYLSYSHTAIYHILHKFSEACENDETLFGVNYVPILRIYLDGITRLMLARH